MNVTSGLKLLFYMTGTGADCLRNNRFALMNSQSALAKPIAPLSEHLKESDGAACPHSNGGGGNKGNKQRPRKQSGGGSKKAKYGTLEKKLVRSSDSFKRINNPKGETIIAADGKPAIFNSQSVKHVVGDHSVKDGRRRMKELFFAQDTTATGISFESLNKGKKQTEFIKEYDTGEGKRYFYTARRGKSNVVYSWHEISSRKFEEKKKGVAK